MCYDSRSVKFLAEMGCGSSHAVNITDRIADEKASIFDVECDSDSVFYSDIEKVKTNGTFPRKTTSHGNEDSESIGNGKLPNETEPSLNGSHVIEMSNDKNTMLERTTNQELQQRLQMLTEQRRQRSAGTVVSNGNSICRSEGSLSDCTTDKSILQLSSQVRRSTFPHSDFISQSPKPSPFGERNVRLKLTDSQREFFSMLDEKIAQGNDYCSEDDKSISSLLSRQDSNRRSKNFSLLHSQHVR